MSFEARLNELALVVGKIGGIKPAVAFKLQEPVENLPTFLLAEVR